MPIRLFPLAFYNCQVRGKLVASDDPADLRDDMLEISMPNDVSIRVGWFPDRAPDGKYRISVSRRMNDVPQCTWAATAEECLGLIDVSVRDNMPLPQPTKNPAKWISDRVRPIWWARLAIRSVASVFDLEAMLYFLAAALVAAGVWILHGNGYCLIAAGAMIAVPPLVSLFGINRKGPSK